jgi:recombination protein RecA
MTTRKKYSSAEQIEDREKKELILQQTLGQLEKAFGKGVIMRFGSRPETEMEVIPSGSIQLDIALGVGGYPRGRIIEIYGHESSGKTTLALHAIAETQKLGGIAAFIDAEHALDPVYAEKIGVQLEDLLISQPDYGEQALNIADQLIRSGTVDLVVIDSVAALVPRAEIEGTMEEQTIGMQARLMSQALRRLISSISKTRCCCIFINQTREKIGVMYGSNMTTTGGNALKFYASIRLEVRSAGAIKAGDKIVGNLVRAKVVKNKVASPYKEALLEIIYGEGISRLGELIDLGVELNVIQKSGAWYSYRGENLAQGRENLKELLRTRTDQSETIEKEIYQKLVDVSQIPKALVRRFATSETME